MTSCIRCRDGRAHTEKIGLGREVPSCCLGNNILDHPAEIAGSANQNTGPLDNLWHPARWMSLCGFEREHTPTPARNKFYGEAALKFSFKYRRRCTSPQERQVVSFEQRHLRKGCHSEMFHSVQGVYFCSQSLMLLTARFCWQAAALTSSLIFFFSLCALPFNSGKCPGCPSIINKCP